MKEAAEFWTKSILCYRLGGGTYGPTGVYFTADSNAQSILTQPPEVLVADEGEPDDLGHIHNIDEDSSDHTLNSKANDNVMEEVISDDENNIEFDSDKETDILKTPMVQAEGLSINVIILCNFHPFKV